MDAKGNMGSIDVADVEQFFEDQKNNGRNKHMCTLRL